MVSHCITTPEAIISKYGLNFSAPLHQLCFDHWCSEDGDGGLLILSSAYDGSASPSRNAYFSTHIDQHGKMQQHDLPSFQAGLTRASKYLFPICVQGLGGVNWIIGTASATITDGVRGGLFFGDCKEFAPLRFLPNCGSRIRIRTPDNIYGTLRNNFECRHPTRFDDAVCRYERFNPAASTVSQLGEIRLVARLNLELTNNRIDFPGLIRPPSRFERAENERILGVDTDYVEPLPDGRVLVSIWNTAQNWLKDFYFSIMRPDGAVDVRIRGTEPRARASFSDRLGLVVVIGETTSQLFDLSGELVANVDHPARSKSVFKRYKLQGIWESIGAVFLSSRYYDQTNSVLIVPEPSNVRGDAYLNHVHQAVIDHDRWLRRESKSRQATLFRWRE